MSKFHCCVPGCNADKCYDRENKLLFRRFPPHSKKELGDGYTVVCLLVNFQGPLIMSSAEG